MADGHGVPFTVDMDKSVSNPKTQRRIPAVVCVLFILFYFILFYFILFYFILFYFILFYFTHGNLQAKSVADKAAAQFGARTDTTQRSSAPAYFAPSRTSGLLYATGAGAIGYPFLPFPSLPFPSLPFPSLRYIDQL